MAQTVAMPAQQVAALKGVLLEAEADIQTLNDTSTPQQILTVLGRFNANLAHAGVSDPSGGGYTLVDGAINTFATGQKAASYYNSHPSAPRDRRSVTDSQWRAHTTNAHTLNVMLATSELPTVPGAADQWHQACVVRYGTGPQAQFTILTSYVGLGAASTAAATVPIRKAALQGNARAVGLIESMAKTALRSRRARVRRQHPQPVGLGCVQFSVRCAIAVTYNYLRGHGDRSCLRDVDVRAQGVRARFRCRLSALRGHHLVR